MSSQDYSKAKVGDTVWWGDVNSRGRGLTKGVVTKVGSKLISVVTVWGDGMLGHRPVVFRKDTGRTNDQYAHQWLIVDLEAYEADLRADKAWNELKQRISRPVGVTYEDILSAAKLLRINIT